MHRNHIQQQRNVYRCVQVTPHSIAGSGLAASQHAALDGNETQDSTAADDTDAAQRVFLQATRHIARAWAIYGSLLPVFRSTADVPRHIVQAIQSLFEEYMLWTVVTFADVSATTVVRGLSGKHARFFRVIRSLMLRSDRASRTRQYEQQLLAATAAADSERKGGPVSTTPEAVEMQEGVGVGGGTLDRLVRGTIACDSLATLARDLLELEPVLVRGLLSIFGCENPVCHRITWRLFMHIIYTYILDLLEHSHRFEPGLCNI